MKAPWLQCISARVPWFSEGQTGKAQDCENTEASGHHQPAPTITSALYNFRKTYQIYTLCPFPRLLQGQLQPAPPDTARCRGMFLCQTKCEKKSPGSGAMCSRAIFLWLRCHGYDATKVVLIKFGFSWTNICFYFTEQRRSFQSWWW